MKIKLFSGSADTQSHLERYQVLSRVGGTPSKSKSEFRVGWRSRDDYGPRDRHYRLQFFLRCSVFCAAVLFALQFMVRHQVIHKGIKFLAGSGGTPSKSKSEFSVG